MNPCRRLIYAGSFFHRPLFLAAQVEPLPSGRGCPQQVSRMKSHIWAVGVGVCLHPPGNLSTMTVPLGSGGAGPGEPPETLKAFSKNELHERMNARASE